MFHADVLLVDLAMLWQGYDAYRRREGGNGYTERTGASGRVGLGASLERDCLWVNVGDVVGVLEESLLETRPLVSAVGYDVLMFKKEYVKHMSSLFSRVNSKRRECKATNRE